MDERLKVSYETMGSSSYMTVTCPEDMELIHYQLEMMISNDIKKLLPVSRQVIDGETVIYYNITSRLPLEQVLEKRKLTRKELLRLIEGAILAIRDGADFRLPSDGIMMEAGKIVCFDRSQCSLAYESIQAFSSELRFKIQNSMTGKD